MRASDGTISDQPRPPYLALPVDLRGWGLPPVHGGLTRLFGHLGLVRGCLDAGSKLWLWADERM